MNSGAERERDVGLGSFFLGALGIGFLSLASVQHFPILSPHALLSVLATAAGGDVGTMFVLPLAFLFWTLPFKPQRPGIPFRSVALAYGIAMFNVPFIAGGLGYGVKYQGMSFVVAVTVENAVVMSLLLVLGSRLRRRPSPQLAFAFHWVLFAWLAWCAFPWLGERF